MQRLSLPVLAALVLATSALAQVSATVIVPPGTAGRVTCRPLSPGRLGLGGRPALAGFALRWERTGEHRPLAVSVRVSNLPGRASAPVVRRRWGPTTLPAQWLHAVDGAGSERTVEVELPAHHTIELLWADLAGYRDWAGPYRLVADPADPAPLGARRPLVLVHGLLWSSPEQSFSHLMQDALDRSAVKHPAMRALRRDFKLYWFQYPSFAGAAAAALELVAALRALYPDSPPPRSIVIVAHSLGGLVSRRALNHDGFGDSVRALYTMATPHRGTLIASVARARQPLKGIVGDFNHAILRNFMGMLVPACPALDDLAWDDHDGALSRPDLAELGVRPNAALAAFNARDRYLDRVTAISGDCPNLRTKLMGIPLDYIRAAQGVMGRQFANSDPLVPCSSGTFAGAPVKRVHLDRVNHVDWAVDAGSLGAVLQRVADDCGRY